MVVRFVVSGFLLLAVTADVRGQDGHDIRANQVVISDEEHWQQWRFAEGTVDVHPAGEVGPHFWRKGTSVATELDIVQNLRRNPPEYLSKKAPEDIELLDAIEARDLNAFLVAGTELDVACENCHSRYWYPGSADPRQAEPGP